MLGVWEDPHRHAALKEAATKQAANFSWTAAAEAVASHYKAVAGMPRIADVLKRDSTRAA